MPAQLRAAGERPRRNPPVLSGVLGALLLASCGDAAGDPIRAVPTPDAALSSGDSGPRDAADAMPDATTMATPTALPSPGSFLPITGVPGSGNMGPGSMHDGRSSDDVPVVPYCANAAHWQQEFADAEQRAAQAIDELRDMGVLCGRDISDQLMRLSSSPELRCSARVHSLDMAKYGIFDTVGHDGSDPGERMTRAGFDHTAAAESIVRYSGSNPNQVVFDLQGDPQGCANLANPEFTSLGIGEYDGLWTFDFATAAR